MAKKPRHGYFRCFRNWQFFFFICLPPEKLRRVTFKRVQKWRVSWIRSIAGAGNDLGKRTKLNFSYTLGSLLKSVAVVSFILENAVFDKFFHDKSSKTTIELIRFNLYKCVFAFNERESWLFESFSRGIYNVPRVLLWMTYDFTVWTASWTDWLAAIYSLDLDIGKFCLLESFFDPKKSFCYSLSVNLFTGKAPFRYLDIMLCWQWVRHTVFAFMDKTYISLDRASYLLQIPSLYFLNSFYSHIGIVTLLWSENTNTWAPIALAYLNTLSVETTRISSRPHPLYSIQSPSPRLNCNSEAKSPSANRPTRFWPGNSVLRDSPAHNICSLGSLGLHCGLTVVAVAEVVLGGLRSFGFGCFVQFPLGTHLKWQQLRVTYYVAWENSRHLAT